jgi:hypothetical protein
MKKINKLNLIRIISFILFTLYLTFNGVDMKIGGFRLYVNGLIKHYQSQK